MPQPGEVMVGGHRRPLIGASLLGVLALIAVLAYVGRSAEDGAPAARDEAVSADAVGAAATGFLEAWEAEDWEALQASISDQSLNAAAVHSDAHRILGVGATDIDRSQVIIDDDGDARVGFTVRWELDGLGEVVHDTVLPLTATDDGWRVRWWYPVVHPDLTPDRRFERVRVFRDRAPILGLDGQPLVSSVPEVVVGVDRSREGDPSEVAAVLAEHVGADPAVVTQVLADEDRTGFQPIATLDVEIFEAARAQLEPVAGIVFHRQSARVSSLPEGLASITGTLGDVTAELLDELGPPYLPGDRVGRPGVERAHERQRAGEPQQEARIVDASGLIETLAYVDGAQPVPVQLTIDPVAQDAARVALAGAPAPAGLVVVDTASGEVRAAVSVPDEEFPRALEGRYPPGSAFKVVTATAALAAGQRSDRVVDCPATIEIGGRVLRNAGGAAHGPLTLVEAMARSCNTAFAQVAAEVGREALTDIAEAYGFGAAYEVGVPSTRSVFPLPASAAELALASIGQAQVEASPLHMASVAAAAATGTWRAPRVIRADEPVEERDLPDGTVEGLAPMLRAVVTDGTGTAADLPDVHGKTGSAQFGPGPDFATHAWFIGYRRDLAFAVVVEGGGGGGAVAAPLAAAFLTALDSSPEAPTG